LLYTVCIGCSSCVNFCWLLISLPIVIDLETMSEGSAWRSDAFVLFPPISWQSLASRRIGLIQPLAANRRARSSQLCAKIKNDRAMTGLDIIKRRLHADSGLVYFVRRDRDSIAYCILQLLQMPLDLVT